MKIQLIRSATVKLNYGGKTFLLDPNFAPKESMFSYAGKSLNPLVDLPMDPKNIIEDIDAVIISHLHTDHFDQTAKNLLSKDLPLFCQDNNAEVLQKQGFKKVSAIKETAIWEEIEITRTNCQHGSDEVIQEMGEVSGFLFKNQQEPVIYWVGDTIWNKEVKNVIEQHQPAIIITHSCGAVWGNNIKIVMDEVDTAKVCQAAPTSIVIAIHMDSYDHSTVSRIDLRKYADEKEISHQHLLIPSDGESYTFTKNQ